MQLLMLIYKHDRNYQALIQWSEHVKELATNLVKVVNNTRPNINNSIQTKEEKEVFSRYYRYK